MKITIEKRGRGREENGEEERKGGREDAGCCLHTGTWTPEATFDVQEEGAEDETLSRGRV